MKNKGTFSLSFEFFPPKTEEAKQQFRNEIPLLAKTEPQFFSVTYGAGGSTRVGTIDTVKLLMQASKKIEVAPHLSCIGSTRDELTEVIHIYQSLGIKRIVALRGDLPSGMGQIGELKYAYELVALIREIAGNQFHIEVAAYPEYHPQAITVQDDVINLKKKVEAGANSAITQYFYNPEAYFYFLDECASQGIFVPVTPGIMPITSFVRLARFSDLCGAEIPLWIRKKLQSYHDDIESIKTFGIEIVYKLCERLIAGGAPGLHFYTLNHAEPSVTLVKMLQPLLNLKVSETFTSS